MATTKTTKKAVVRDAVRRQSEELLKLLLKKTGTKHSDLVELAEQEFIIANISILTSAEKKQFDKLVF